MKRGNFAAVGTGSFLVTLLLSSLCSPAQADWLLTRDGKVIETLGAWEVRGKLVRFTTPTGTLSSIRVEELDLEASRVETQRRNAPPAPAPAPTPTAPKKPVLVLTDADVKHVDPATGAAASASAFGDIIMYTTDWCPVCRKAKSLFAAAGVPFIEKDIEKSPEARQEYEAKSGETAVKVPLIDIDGELSFGIDGPWLQAALTRRALRLAAEKAEAVER